MRRNTINEKELPAENLAIYQLVKKKTNGFIKDFAEKIGVSPQGIQRLFKIDGRYNVYPRISRSMREKIADVFDLDEDWLEQATTRIENERFESGYKPSVKQLPMISERAQAGKLTDSIEENSEMMDIIPRMPRYDCTISVDGDSMEPTYKAGDILALRKVDEKSFIEWGSVYVLDTKSGIVIKRIYEDENGLKCSSDNENYKPFIVPWDMIYHIYKIVGFMRFGNSAIRM